jgi:hypothetical protein
MQDPVSGVASISIRGLTAGLVYLPPGARGLYAHNPICSTSTTHRPY